MHPGLFLRVLLCAHFLSPVVLHASPLTITLDEAVSRGIENNLSLKKSLIDLSTAEYSANRLWSEVFPSINGTLGASYSSALFSGSGFEMNRDGANLNAGLGISLTFNAGIPHAVKNIKLAYQARLLSYEDARNQLEIQLTKSFYGLIADRENLSVLADMLRLAQLQHEKNQVAFNNGLAGELTLLQSRLGMENARYSLSAANSSYANQFGEFLAQLGVSLDSEAELDGEIKIEKEELDAERLIRENISRRPDIVSRRREIERLENAERQLALSGRAPSLRLSADWNSRSFDPFADTLSGSATVNIPVDPWIRGTGRSQSLQAAKAEIDKARLDLQNAEESAVIQIRSLAANLRNSWDSVEIARLSIGVAERGYELTDQGFRNGTVNSLALEDARNNLVSARQRLLQSELSYLNMILDMSAALNVSWKDLLK